MFEFSTRKKPKESFSIGANTNKNYFPPLFIKPTQKLTKAYSFINDDELQTPSSSVMLMSQMNQNNFLHDKTMTIRNSDNLGDNFFNLQSGGQKNMLANLKYMVKNSKKKESKSLDLITDKSRTLQRRQLSNDMTMSQITMPNFEAETKLKILKGMTTRFSRTEEKLVTAIKNKNIKKIFKYLKNYNFLEYRNFWVEIQSSRMDIVERLFTKLNIAGIILGLLYGVGAYGAYNIIEAFKAYRDDLALMYACAFKNSVGVVPKVSTKLLFKTDLLPFLQTFTQKPEFTFICDILNANKKQDDNYQKVNVINDAYNIHKFIEAEKFNSLVEYLMVECNKKISEVARFYYSNFGISIIEHVLMYDCVPFYLSYIRHTITCALSQPTYFALTIGNCLNQKKQYNCVLYLLLCILELKYNSSFDIFQEYYDSPLKDKLKDYLDTSLVEVTFNMIETYKSFS